MLTDNPVLQQWKNDFICEAAQNYIIKVLKARFKSVPEELKALIRSEMDQKRLEKGIEIAAVCESLNSFKSLFSRKRPGR